MVLDRPSVPSEAIPLPYSTNTLLPATVIESGPVALTAAPLAKGVAVKAVACAASVSVSSPTPARPTRSGCVIVILLCRRLEAPGLTKYPVKSWNLLRKH